MYTGPWANVPWSECSRTCGGGNKTRTYLNNGVSVVDIITCNSQPCNIR